jgi:cell division protease FtsH
MVAYPFIFLLGLNYVNSLIAPEPPKFPSVLPKIPQTTVQPAIQPITVKNLIKGIENHDFDQIYFKDNNRVVYATEGVELKDDDSSESNPEYVYVTNISPYITTKLVDVSLQNGVNPVFIDSTAVSSPGFLGIFNLIPFIIYGLLFGSLIRSFMMRNGFGSGPNVNSHRNQGGASNGNSFSFPGLFGKGFNELDQNRPNITLADWAGSKEVLYECTEIVSYLKNSTNYDRVGAMIPKGILMEGPPGTGKTLLAKAIANEADANFIEASGSEFVEMYVGLGALRVRKLFEEARKNRPCVIFIDEIDAVGRQRSQSMGGGSGNDEKDQTLNQLLAEMDGFKDNEGIMVLAATNRRDILDNALLRPGRFDRIIRIPLPDTRSRAQIFDLYLKNKQMEPGVNATELARFTSGYSGAQIKNIINEAAICAARQNETVITKNFIFEAIEKAIIGIKKTIDDRSYETRRRVAIHELGHAFMVNEFPNYFDLKKVSIQASYSGVGGFTLYNEKEDISEGGLYTKDFLMKRLMIALGGKAAETIFYGEDFVSLGATMDLNTANELAVDMIERYGMGEKLKVFYRKSASMFSGGDLSERTKSMIDTEAAKLVQTAYQMTVEVLTRRKNQMESMINNVLDRVTINDAEFSGFLV